MMTYFLIGYALMGALTVAAILVEGFDPNEPLINRVVVILFFLFLWPILWLAKLVALTHRFLFR